MIKMTFYLFEREALFTANLAIELTYSVLGSGMQLLGKAAVAIVFFLFGYFGQAIAGQVIAGVAFIAVKHLVRVVVKATKTDFAISLEELMTKGLFTLNWFGLVLAVDKSLQHFRGFVLEPMLEIF